MPQIDSKFSVTYCTVFLQNKFHFEHEMYNTGVDRRLPLDMLTCTGIRNCIISFFLILFLFYFTILYWFCHTLTWICHGCTCVIFQSDHLNHYFEYNTSGTKIFLSDCYAYCLCDFLSDCYACFSSFLLEWCSAHFELIFPLWTIQNILEGLTLYLGDFIKWRQP